MMSELMLCPGPVSIPERILDAMRVANCHHRSSEFALLFQDVRRRYQSLVKSELGPVFLSGSGTAAMEAAMRGLFQEGDEIAFLSAGKFGERFGHIASILGLKAIAIDVPYGESISTEELEKRLTGKSGLKGFCLQHCETSTAVEHDAAKLIACVKRLYPEALTVVDGITSIGVFESDHISLDVDVLICGSQKALMLPPGLSMLSFNEKALQRIRAVKCGSLYFNLELEFDMQSDGKTCWTSPTHHIFGLAESLRMLEEEGLENVFSRHAELSELSQSHLLSLGCSLFPQAKHAPGLTAFSLPGDIPPSAFKKHLLEEENLRIAGGQGELKSKILRFGHMGSVQPTELKEGLKRFERALSTYPK